MMTLRTNSKFSNEENDYAQKRYLIDILSGLILLISLYLEYIIDFHSKCVHIMNTNIFVKDNFPVAIHNLDIYIMKLVNPTLLSPSNTIIFIAFTLIGGSIFLLGYAIALALKSGFKDAIIFLASLLSTIVIVYLLKILVVRPRPFLTIAGVIPLECSFSPSFPSGHAARFAVLAGIQFGDLGRYRYIYLALSFIVGFSRIYLGVHYPSDVIAGWIIGYLTGYFSAKYLKVYILKLFPMI